MKPSKQTFAKAGNRYPRGASRSQGVVEFALALPILLLMLFGIIDFSLLFSGWLLIQNVSRQAVRYAVTGQFDVERCLDYDGVDGCIETDEEARLDDMEQARLQSIYAEAEEFRAGLLVNDLAGQSDPGYIVTTVCSSRPTGAGLPRVADPGQMGSPTDYSLCDPTEDAGGPNDTVIIMVDFNHPYITPLINDLWPMVHLFSAHRGTVESFRVSRLIDLPPEPEQPTLTASLTLTPSLTFTPSLSYTPSSTASPTESPTPTNSITPSPTPDCDLFTLSNWVQTTYGGSSAPRITIVIANGSDQDALITRVELSWQAYDAANPGQSLNRVIYNYITVNGTDDSSSPTSRLFSPGLDLPGPSSRYFYFDFVSYDAAWPGIVPANAFGLSVQFDNGCVTTKAAAATPTTSRTPTISSTPTRSSSPTISNTPTQTGTRTNTRTPTVSPTRSNTPTVSRTPTRSRTPSATSTRRPSNTPTTTLTFTRTWTRSITPSPTRTFTRSRTPTRSQSPTITRTPTRSYTPSITRTPTNSRTRTPSRTPSITRTPTRTPTISNTPSRTYTPTRSYTPSQTFTRTNTGTRTYTPTRTFTPPPLTPTPSKTKSPTISPTPSKTICFDC